MIAMTRVFAIFHYVICLPLQFLAGSLHLLGENNWSCRKFYMVLDVYDDNFSSIKLHRTLAILHFSAMVAQPFLAKNAVKNGKKYDDLMDAHLKAGTIAFFTLSLDMLGLTFFK